MISSRQWTRLGPLRAARCSRAPGRTPIRFQSSSAGRSSRGSSASTHVAQGIAGGLIGAAIFAGAYSYTPSGQAASKVNKALREANKKYDEAAKTLQQKTPNADEAMNSIKQFAYSYVAWIPGGRQYVDAAFDDWEAIRKNHKEEANEIINDAYKQFQDLSKAGLSLESASKAYEILADLSKRITELSGDAISDILDNHPTVKEKLGGNVDKLKSMGEEYGPEAKKQVEDTWKEVRNVLAGGISAANLDKARKVIEDKVQKVQKVGDGIWQKGLDEIKPQLEKNPKIKELVESNTDALKQGNIKELFDKAKSAIQSGDMGDLQEYVNNAVDKAKNSDTASKFGLDKYVKMIPQGDEIWSKLQQLHQVAQKHGDKGQKLIQETVGDMKEVLEKKSKEAEKIGEQAKKDTKEYSQR